MTRTHVRLLGPCFKTGRTGCRLDSPVTLSTLPGRHAPREQEGGRTALHAAVPPRLVPPARDAAPDATKRGCGGSSVGRWAWTDRTSQTPALPRRELTGHLLSLPWPPANRSRRSPRGSAPAAALLSLLPCPGGGLRTRQGRWATPAG
jgi:hypothetical protein